eukprot:3538657-Rhodomonas_salina.1
MAPVDFKVYTGARTPLIHSWSWGQVRIFRGQATGSNAGGNVLWRMEEAKLYQWKHCLDKEADTAVDWRELSER